MTTQEVKEKYGIDPTQVGIRHRGFWEVSELDEDDKNAGVNIGDLVVKARDGADNEEDDSVTAYKNFRFSFEDSLDSTYRYYVFSPVNKEGKK